MSDGRFSSPDATAVGREMHRLCAELYRLCRSITGDGVRSTLAALQCRLPVEIHEVATGTRVLDWTIPPEWNVRDAYIADRDGRRVVDFAESNLHLVSYSVPVHTTLSRAELDSHLHSLPDRPDWVPYRTSYYEPDWGFCVSERQRSELTDDRYEVVVDTTLAPGSLTYGECLLPGETDEEVLLSTHVCHPSLANDNLTGITLAAFLGASLSAEPHYFSYRLLFVPGTIGSITWLARNEDRLSLVRHGLVLTGVGDPGAFTYKRSRRGDRDVDRAVAHVLRTSGAEHRVVAFDPYGYDERQYCSPGFDLPVGRFGRTPHGEYPEYHTSADDLAFVRPERLGAALAAVREVLAVLEGNRRYRNLHPKGEPQLGRRGLYRAVGGAMDPAASEIALLWVLSFSDGEHDLLDIADRADLPFRAVHDAAKALEAHDLIAPVRGA